MITTLKTKSKPGPLERFLGEDARVIRRGSIPVNNFIKAERLEVSLPEDAQPEDTGMLYLFPIDDNKFCMQLCFMQYADTSSVNAEVYSLRFLPAFFDQYPPEVLMANQPFRFDQTTELQFSVCSKSRLLLAQLREAGDLTPFLNTLQKSETSLQLLRRVLECITVPFTVCQVPACRFLAYESEREKIREACLILEQQIDQPLTIPELARKVAINECYLKKGFKALVGKTVHDYQQDLRINRAKELLQKQGLSVTEVANTLGYSSISHFSTAFKRVTGMKPCELLA
jgi:AraC-like DNA-binding protein